LLFAAVLLLGVAYVVVFIFLRHASRDFIAAAAETRARASADRGSLHTPLTLAFGKNQNGTAFLGSGWGVHDAAGVWMEDSPAFLHLQLAGRPSGAVARMRFDAYSVDETNAVAFSVNGHKISRATVSRGGVQPEVTLMLPDSLFGNDGRLDFAIDFAPTQRPWWNAPYRVRREFHLLLRSIEIRPAEAR
jgi:hypothetical protein